MKLYIIPLQLQQANRLVDQLHRHHKPAQGHKFSLGLVDENGDLRGACIVGRPVARLGGDPNQVLEITRLVTDGTPNACSMLYGAAARVGKNLGYQRIQTYILDTEPGTSLKAAGWKLAAMVRGRQWQHTDGKQRRTDQPTEDKQRWEYDLNKLPEILYDVFKKS